ncbi:hypothetical protein SRABI128_04901 [Microbacterium sp. Bi128]|nr:hypothetical protein SRABI128_04901 [Microbacterium sp. Bi128]
MQRGQRGAVRPVGHTRRRVLPQCLGEPLRAAVDEPVPVIGVGVDHAKDFEDRVGEVGVPATGAESHLPEGLAVGESGFLEGVAAGDEAVERLLVQLREQRVPEVLDPGCVPGADGVLHLGERGAVVHGSLPRVRHLTEERRQVRGGLGIVFLARELDHRAGGRRRQRIGEGPGLQPEQVHVVVEGLAGFREPHSAEVRHDPRRGRETGGPQPAADPVGLVDNRPQAQLHELIRGHQSGQSGTDDGDLGPVQLGRHRSQALRVGEVVVVAEREVRIQHGDGRRARFSSGPGSRKFGGDGHEISAFISWCVVVLSGWRLDRSR